MRPDFLAKKLLFRGLPARLEIMLALLGVPRKHIPSRVAYMLDAHAAPQEHAVIPAKLEFELDGVLFEFSRSHAISLELAEKIAKKAYKTAPNARAKVLRRIGDYRARQGAQRQGELSLFTPPEVSSAEDLPKERQGATEHASWLSRAENMLTRVSQLSPAEATELNQHLSLADRLGIELTKPRSSVPPPMAQPVVGAEASAPMAEPVSSPVFELLQPGEIGNSEELELSIQREATELRTTARALHARLGVLTRFTEWWPRRCEQLIDGEDYGIVLADKNNSGRGRPAEDFWLTADAAKYICMLEKTAIGDAVRRYFIRAEKQLRLTQHRLYETEKADRLTLTTQLDAERAINARLRIDSAESMAFYEAVMAPGKLYTMKQAAELLTNLLRGVGGPYVGHLRLMEMLRRDGHLLTGKASVNDVNHPSAEMTRRGLMRNFPKKHKADAKQITNVPRFTGPGLAWMLRTYCPMPDRHLELLLG